MTKNGKTSSNLTAGRLEVFFSGKWGSICSDGFTSTDAKFYCNSMTGSTTVLRYGPIGSDGLKYVKCTIDAEFSSYKIDEL